MAWPIWLLDIFSEIKNKAKWKHKLLKHKGMVAFKSKMKLWITNASLRVTGMFENTHKILTDRSFSTINP